MTTTTPHHATSILESLGGVATDGPPNSIDVTLDIGEGYTLRLYNSWRQNYLHWFVIDERAGGEPDGWVVRGYIYRLDAAEDNPRFAITRERDSVSIHRIKDPHDYRAIGRAFERLGYVLGDWLVRDGGEAL